MVAAAAAGITMEQFLRLPPSARRSLERELTRPQVGAFAGSVAYSVTDAALMLGVSVDTLRRHEKDGSFPTIKRDSQQRRVYSHADIDRIAAVLNNR